MYLYIDIYIYIYIYIYEYVYNAWPTLANIYTLINIYITPGLRSGRRRLIGSPKLQIIFHKRATKYRSLLRKMTYKDKGSYESSPPCSSSKRCRVKVCDKTSPFEFVGVRDNLSLTHTHSICTHMNVKINTCIDKYMYIHTYTYTYTSPFEFVQFRDTLSFSHAHCTLNVHIYMYT